MVEATRLIQRHDVVIASRGVLAIPAPIQLRHTVDQHTMKAVCFGKIRHAEGKQPHQNDDAQWAPPAVWEGKASGGAADAGNDVVAR